jgi:hypothetical protein
MDKLMNYLENNMMQYHEKYSKKYNLQDVTFYITERFTIKLVIVSDDNYTNSHYNTLLASLKPVLENITNVYINILYGSKEWFESVNEGVFLELKCCSEECKSETVLR